MKWGKKKSKEKLFPIAVSLTPILIQCSAFSFCYNFPRINMKQGWKSVFFWVVFHFEINQNFPGFSNEFLWHPFHAISFPAPLCSTLLLIFSIANGQKNNFHEQLNCYFFTTLLISFIIFIIIIVIIIVVGFFLLTLFWAIYCKSFSWKFSLCVRFFIK